jgi:hypothetical protein
LKKEFLNQLINFVWTILCFAAVIAYWIDMYSGQWLYFFVAFSISCGFLPAGFFRSIQLSKNAAFYEKAGVRWIRKFVQNGDFVNKTSRNAGEKPNVIKNRTAIEKYLKTIDMYERYHFVCFVFFLLTSFHAAFHKAVLYSALISICNFLYNILPILLQQYNRIRILKLKK